MMSTHKVYEAARRLGVRNVIRAGSETTLGESFSKKAPRKLGYTPEYG